RDQERLWHALGAWPRIAKALERGNIPVALRQRHYLRDAAEIYAMLSEPTPAIDEFLAEVRSLPPVAETAEPDPEFDRPRNGRGPANRAGEPGTSPRRRRRRRSSRRKRPPE
ncbi:MAG: hypothetical protein AB7I09_18375, partial [Planctomycetota bacterium]